MTRTDKLIAQLLSCQRCLLVELRARSYVERALKSPLGFFSLLGAKLKVIVDGIVEALLHFFSRGAFKYDRVPNAGDHTC